ncbi:hypothetical protein, partial [Frankia sp. CcWB3]
LRPIFGEYYGDPHLDHPSVRPSDRPSDPGRDRRGGADNRDPGRAGKNALAGGRGSARVAA